MEQLSMREAMRDPSRIANLGAPPPVPKVDVLVREEVHA
jgi:hypothetical protein